MDKWGVLSQKMLEERDSTGYVFEEGRLTPESLQAVYETGFAVMLEDQGEIFGFAALWRMKDIPEAEGVRWFEAGSLFLLPTYRGRGLAKQLYVERLKFLTPGDKCFIVSHNPAVTKLALAHRFVQASREDWLQLAPYAFTCGGCSRLQECRAGGWKFRADPKQCQLFVYVR